MPEDPFLVECDRLSQLVNPAQYEQLRWSREDGPMLARLVSLGAEIVQRFDEYTGFTVLRDPEGNELCIVQERGP